MKIIIYLLILVTIYSCGSPSNGKIEHRINENNYLVNTSKSKSLSFTVRITSIENDSTYRYSTEIINLAPGDETNVGQDTSSSKGGALIDYTIWDSIDHPAFTPQEFISRDRDIFSRDDVQTAASQSKMTFSEYILRAQLLPLSTVKLTFDKHFKYKYEITGESPWKKEKEKPEKDK